MIGGVGNKENQCDTKTGKYSIEDTRGRSTEDG